MKQSLLVFVCVVFALTFISAGAVAKNTQGKLADYKFMEVPQAPASESEFGGTMFQAAAANTTVLGWWQ
ncbi:MAG: hypothetical protein P8181_07465, partial [bacterium]